MRRIQQIVISILFINFWFLRVQAIDNNKLVNSVVTIKSLPTLGIYGKVSEKNGLGCIISKTQGLVMTTKNLANYLCLSKYEVTFHNGIKVEARLKYFDPWVDLAILQLDPNVIPEECNEATLPKESFKGNENIYVSSIQNDSVTIIEAFIVDKYCIHDDPIPQPCYQAQLKNNGNFTSAPIFDSKGNLLSIAQRSEAGMLLFLDPECVFEMVRVKDFSTPRIRKNVGIVCELYSLTDAVAYRQVPVEIFENYMKSFPHFKGNILAVKSIIKGTTAYSVLNVGDIILSVDGINVGPCLQIMDSVINNSKKDSVTFEILRNGDVKSISVKTYDMEHYRIKKFIDFSSTIFFQSDELYSLKTGIALGDLTFYKSRNSTSFSRANHVLNQSGSMIFIVDDLEFDNKPIRTLENFVEKIPELFSKKNFILKYHCIVPQYNGLSEFYSGMYLDDKIIAFVDIDENARDCFFYKFDGESSTWVKKLVLF